MLFPGFHKQNQTNTTTQSNKVTPAPVPARSSSGGRSSSASHALSSEIKTNVQKAGGKVEGGLRFSIQWNDEDYCPNDYDAHCLLPTGNEIYFVKKKDKDTRGELDVDIITPERGTPAVENIIWPSVDSMKKGVYHLFVRCYTHRGGKSGFKAEVECGGRIYSYIQQKSFSQDHDIAVADVTYNPVNGFSVKGFLPSPGGSQNNESAHGHSGSGQNTAPKPHVDPNLNVLVMRSSKDR